MASEKAIQAPCQAEKIQKIYKLQHVISLKGGAPDQSAAP
jgi:hypothetical protein